MVPVEAFEARKAQLKGDGKAGRWFSPLELHVLPKLGRVPVEELDQQDIRNTLAPIWHKKADTARKAMNRLGIVMRHAAAMGLDVDKQATEKAKALLGTSRHQPKHVPAMDWREVPAFYQRQNEGTITNLALRLLILTAARSSEVRFCHLDEIEGDLWTIPAARMKLMFRGDLLHAFGSGLRRGGSEPCAPCATGCRAQSPCLQGLRDARHDGATKEGCGGMTEPDEPLRIFVPLKVRKQNGRPKIMPPATYLPSEDRTQDPHILRAIGRAWGWRRRLEAGEINTVTDLAKAVGLAERHVSRQLRLAYLAPGVLKRLVYKREVPAVTLLKLTDVAALPWHEQSGQVFD
jgi:hypothetical protein